jgi:ribonuclease R
LTLLGGRRRPLLSATGILRELGLGRDAIRPLRSLLRALEAKGRLERVDRRYRLRRPDGLVEGSFTPGTGADPRGGLVAEESGAVWRVAEAGGAQAGDRVLLQPIGEPGRQRGEILDVLVGRRATWVGIFHRRGKRGFVTPYRDDAEWLVDIAQGDVGEARDGEVVVVRPSRRREGRARAGRRGAPMVRPEGQVVEVLGPPGHPEADFRAVAWRRRLPLDFPTEVLAAAEALPGELPAAEISRRVDLRDRSFVTIDPASARDHDDALCVEAAGEGHFRLWVAIADVAHFVAEGSPIDREALRRGNSIYFPDRAIPMLPERLSGDLCSLRPGVDRLVIAVELDVTAGGEVLRRNFYPAVIRSRARLVYRDVAPVMEGAGDGALEPEIAEQLRCLARVTAALRRRRLATGSIDLDLPEPLIVFGQNGRPIDVVASPRTLAHRAVEDSMLAANRAVAEVLAVSGRPAVYRNHEPPLPQDVETLRDLFEAFGLEAVPLAADASPPPRWIAEALKRVSGRPEERLVHRVVLRSMTQARYGAVRHGHFALAFPHYTHFTSPIRRYADLVVHRALTATLEERPAAARAAHAERRRRGEWMRRVAGRVSWRERIAMEAEREVADLQKCAFMRGHVGEVFAATMTGAAPFGLWLTLDEHFVEGLVHVSTLPEFVEFDERHHAFEGSRSGERFALGDRFDVRLESVDQIRAHIDFQILARRPAQ